MKQTIDTKQTIRDLVTRHPRTRRVLDEHGVDYCCGGDRPLGEAAAESRTGPDRLIESLEAAVAATEGPEESEERRWSAAPIGELAQHIVERHHTFLRRELPRIDDLLGRVQKAHGRRHGDMLDELGRTFDAMRLELETHLYREEHVLFPYVAELDAQRQEGEAPPRMHCGTIRYPISQMEHEHNEAGAALRRMRELTGGYALPDDACPTFEELYAALRELENDLHEHIHLENNILFPRAMEREAALKGR